METPKYDLLEFIRNEKKRWNSIEADKTPSVYLKHVSKSLYDMYLKLRHVSELNLIDTLRTGLTLIFHVYWILFSYTYNLKLTMFLSERAILLFTEFIVMSRNPLLNRDMTFIPNINDAIQFSYRKTIGPLKLNQTRNRTNRKKIMLYRDVTRDIQDIMMKRFTYLLHHYHHIPEHKSVVKEHNSEEELDQPCWFTIPDNWNKKGKNLIIPNNTINTNKTNNINKIKYCQHHVAISNIEESFKLITPLISIYKKLSQSQKTYFTTLTDKLLHTKLNYNVNNYYKFLTELLFNDQWSLESIDRVVDHI